MPDSSDNYQLPSWPPTTINRDLWNAVMGSIAARLSAREELEATFEALIAQGTQASLDYIQATVAPQIASLQSSIELAQEQIDQIVVDGIAPNAAKLGGQLPAYYAPASVLPSKADVTYVDQELLDLATAVQLLLDQKAGSSETVNALANRLRFDGAQALTEPQKTQARNNLGFTPALVAYNKWETAHYSEPSGVSAAIVTDLVSFSELRIRLELQNDVTASTFNLQFGADNGVTWIGATNYFTRYTYGVDANAPLSLSRTLSAVDLSLLNPVGTLGFGAGIFGTINLSRFNKNRWTVGNISSGYQAVTTGSIVSHEGVFGLATSQIHNALRVYSGAAFSGTLHIEGKRG